MLVYQRVPLSATKKTLALLSPTGPSHPYIDHLPPCFHLILSPSSIISNPFQSPASFCHLTFFKFSLGLRVNKNWRFPAQKISGSPQNLCTKRSGRVKHIQALISLPIYIYIYIYKYNYLILLLVLLPLFT